MNADQAHLVRELSPGERPRERLLRSGSASLSEVDLVAILLRTGRPGLSAIGLARELLARFGGLAGLLGSNPNALRGAGIGPAKAASLVAGLELGRRLARAQLPQREPLSHPSAVATYLSLRYHLREQEIMGALVLDVRNRLISDSEIYRGTLSRAAVEPRSILKRGLLCDAASFVLFHTHPSGDPSPSAEDLCFTRRIAKAGDVVGIQLTDHLILGSAGRWLSLKRRGAW